MTANWIRFGEFELDPAGFELRRAGTRVRIERIPMQLLILLVSSGGRLVPRDKLIAAIWGEGRFIEAEAAINTAVRKLRRVLGDCARQPTFIETVMGKGLRFLPAASTQKVSEEARDLYTRGLHCWNRKAAEWYLEAIRLYQQAIDVDPDYALPWLGLAKSWIMMGIHGLQPADNVYPRARAAAEKALQLDPSLAEAHTALGDIVKGYDWDWSSAEPYYLRALSIEPSCGLAHQWYANLLSITGRHDDAITHARRGRELAPLALAPASFLGFTLYRARRFREALKEAECAVTLDPNSPIANWFLGHAREAIERFPEALAAFAHAAEKSQDASFYLSALARVSVKAGDRRRSSAILAHLAERAAESYVSPLDLAIVEASLGRTDEALEHFETAFEQRVMRLTELPMHSFDAIRSHPRVQAILAAMKLQPTSTK
jgi:DNA-binding winged helix-turn-helix (wHTH) protein/Tfp pilus assembly protein PilF